MLLRSRLQRVLCTLIRHDRCGLTFMISKQSDGPRTAEIKQQIFSEVQGSQTVSAYYTKLKQLWEELKNREASPMCCFGRLDCSNLKQLAQREEQDRILKFLMGLNDSFTATRGQILMMEPRPSISKVFNLVSQEERQRSIKGGSSSSNVTFQTSQTVTPSGQSDQVVAAYASGYNKNQNRMVCSHCGNKDTRLIDAISSMVFPQDIKHKAQS